MRRRGSASARGSELRRHIGVLLASVALTIVGVAILAGPALAAPPSASIDPTVSASYVTAEVSGTVDPNGNLTYWSFETSTDGEHWSGFGYEGLVEEGDPPKAVSTELHGLTPNTHYFVRLSAYNFADPVVSTSEPYPEFTTLPVAKPTVVATDDASEVEYTTAKASGTVERPANPDPAFDVNCVFEYVTDAQFSATGFDGAGQVPCAENPITTTGPKAVSAKLTGLTVGTTYHLRLSASTAGGTTRKAAAHTFITIAPGPATVSINDPVIDSPIAGHFSGDINPGGTDPAFNVKWHFVCTPACPGLEGEIPADEANHHVSVDVTLKPETAYEVTLVAENAATQTYSVAKSFSTDPGAAPIVVTGDSNSPDGTTASIYGTVNPLGLATTYSFEYGTTTAYGTKAPLGEEGQAGAGFGPLPVGQDLSGLSPETTYHYRVVGTSSAGTVVGADRTFTTSPASIPARAFELVSPADKGGANILRESEALASIDGNAYSFAGQVALHNTGTETAPYFTHYVAHRTDDGWSNLPVDVSQLPTENPTNVFRLLTGISRDGSKVLVVSRQALAPGADEGGSNLYLRDTTTGALTTVYGSPTRNFYDEVTLSPCCFARTFGGGTPNFDHVLIYSAYSSLLPGAPVGALYDFTGGELHLASVSPGGTPIPGTSGGATDREANRISADGSKIFFGNPENGAVYVRIDNTSTQAITKSRKAGSLGKLQSGIFVGASSDGRVAYVISSDLTNDSPSGESALYRYEVEADELEMLTPLGEGFGIQVSNDGETVYFRSRLDLAEGGEGSNPKYYVWRNGTISTVASFTKEFDAAQVTEFSGWASRNGRYFAFRSNTPLTDYDTTAPGKCIPNSMGEGNRINCAQIYRYDAETQTVTCASCPPDGRPAVGSPHNGLRYDEFSNEQIPRIVTNTGQVFFDSPSRLVPEDSNGARDVYEYDGENVRLISSGRGRPVELSGIGGEGRDVFVLTQEQLVKVDTDSAADIYDARVGGGIASQNQEPPVPPCKGEDCRGLPPVPPAPPPGGSETTFGPGSPNPKRAKACGKGRHKKKVHGKTRCVKNGKKQHGKRRQGR